MLSDTEVATILDRAADTLEAINYTPSTWVSGLIKNPDNCFACEVGSICLAMGAYTESERTVDVNYHREDVEQVIMRTHPEAVPFITSSDAVSIVGDPDFQYKMYDINRVAKNPKELATNYAEAKKNLINFLRQRAAELREPAEETSAEVEERSLVCA